MNASQFDLCANKIVSNLQYLQKMQQAPPSSAMANRLLKLEKDIDQIFDDKHMNIFKISCYKCGIGGQVELIIDFTDD